MKYNLVLFDADGTLFDYEKAEISALRSTFVEFNIDGNFERNLELYKSINSEIWRQFELKKISADELKTERFSRLFRQINERADAQKFSDAYLINLSRASFLFEGVEPLIERLSVKIKMAIITNGLTKVQRPRFDVSSIGKYMAEYIISEEIGMQKPEPAIFDYALNRLNHKDKRSAMIVGDNLHSDILGGSNFGIDTCWFNPNSVANETEIIPTYTISELTELIEIIG